jgi:V/A-type H+-transporting ATPase subunit A
MLQYILKFGRMEADAIKKGASAAKVSSLESRGMIPKMKWTKEEELEQLVNDLKSKMNQDFDNLSKEVSD